MKIETLPQADVALVDAITQGFAKTPKRLPSWLFYDETGDKIFQAIMRMPEYYLTACEYEIMRMQKDKIMQRFQADHTDFNLVELGAGDGFKTEILLTHFREHHLSFRYSPIDVSENVLAQLENRLRDSISDLVVNPIHARYSEALDLLKDEVGRKVFLFLGANIGNFSVPEATDFIRSIGASMHDDDQLMIGFDLKKDPRLIKAAYDDPHGVTRDFNLNLLVRLNRELGAQFQLDQFTHYPFYDPETGLTKSYLISQQAQDVFIEGLEKSIHFDRWEVIHTEVSQKYDMAMIERLAEKAGLEVTEYFYDCKHYFCDVLLKRKQQ